MKKWFPLRAVLCLLSVALFALPALAQTSPSASPGYDAAKAALITSAAPAAPYVRPVSAGTATGGCYINTDETYTDFNDGFSTDGSSDDGSTGAISLPFSFSLYGTLYTQVYVNNNGNLTFTGPDGVFSASGFPFSGVAMVAPFWGDVMTQAPYIPRYKVFAHKFIATWSNVGYFASHYTQTDSFQVIITDGTDASIGLGNNVAFHYGQMNWTTGDASDGSGGFGGTPATVGVNSGDGTHFIQVGRFGVNSSDYSGASSDFTNGVHYLEGQCFNFNVADTGNIPPSVSGLPPGNIDTIACGSTHTYFLNWIGPETDQTDSSYVDSGSLCNMTVSQTAGFTTVSRDTVSITGASCNMGTHHFYVTGVDNHGGITIDTVTIVVVPLMANPSSNSPVCAGNLLLFSSASASGATYSWAGPGGFTSTLQNPYIPAAAAAASGIYTVTITTAGGCSSTGTTSVTVTSSSLSGTMAICVGGTTSLTPTIVSSSWSSSDGSIASVNSAGAVTGIAPGTAVISFTSAAGCTSTGVVTVSAVPTITGASSVCAGNTTTLSGSPTGGTWTSSGTSVATVSSVGLVTGIASGSVMISYTTGGAGCAGTSFLIVNAAPVITSASGNSACSGSTISLTSSSGGGSWSSSNTTVATVNSSGIVSALSGGTATISYMSSAGCSASVVVTILATPAAISGSTSLCVGGTNVLTDGTTGSWSSSNASVATIGLTSGILTGISSGSATITITGTNGCTNTTLITVSPSVSAISGPSTVCAGSSVTFSDATSGSWSSSSTIASVNGSTGVVTGNSTGTAVISLATGAGGGCTVTKSITVLGIPAAITGNTGICTGSTTTLNTTATGGSWSSTNTAVATISGTGSAVVTGLSAGTSVISYTVSSGCARTVTVTVSSGLPAITGSTSACVGHTITLSDSVSGGTWGSSATSIATVTSAGIVTGVSAGSVTITYTASAGCYATTMVAVSSAPAAISGATSVCVGSLITLTDGTSGGSWSSSNTSLATVDGGGNVMGVATASTVTISYTTSSGCSAVKSIQVKALPAAIAGTMAVCIGSTGTLTDPTTGGSSWVSSNTSIATINSATGLMTGISAGNATITYTLTSGCAATATVTINALPASITGTPVVCVGSVTSLSDASTGGTWSSSASGTASVGTDGTVTGVAAGTARITYSQGAGCNSIVIVTVNALPNAITGITTICLGSTSALHSTTTGATWSSSDDGTASVGSTGIVTGNILGSATISYTNSAGCSRTALVTVSSGVPAIGGSNMVCVGKTTTLTDSTSGGTWTSSTTAVATIISTGLLTGVSAGTANITYAVSGGCRAIETITVNPAVATITGTTSVCIGSSIALASTTAGGSWSSSNNALGTVDASGNVTGIAAGTPTITYMLPTGCYVTKAITIKALPAAIGGATSICAGSTGNLTDATTGATSWVSSNTSVATVSVTGVMTGVSAGTSTITYTVSTGCSITGVVTINVLPAPISGVSAICLGSTASFSDTTSGGTWTSSTVGVATIGSSGVVTGVAAGTARITYATAAGCKATYPVTVNALPNVITGTTTVCLGSTTALSSTTPGGSWSTSDAAIASVGSTGIVTGVANGTATISYTAATGCSRTAAVTVSSGVTPVLGSTSVCVGKTTTLSDSASGGTWSSSASTTASITSTGILTGVAAGTANVTYTLSAGCRAIQMITVNPAAATITGTTSVCVGSAIALATAGTGGAWSSSNTSMATVDSSGNVTGVGAGTITISYTLPTGCFSTKSVTVKATPAAIGGATTVCVGTTGTLTDATTGATSWTSSDATVATVGITSGILTGVSAGTATITYLINTGCSTTAVVTVNSGISISGTLSACIGATTTLSTSGSGVWSSSSASVATVGSSTGIVTGVAAGTARITFAGSGCNSIVTVTVGAIPNAITGTTTICSGSTSALSSTTTGGMWSSSDSTIASVGSTGIVTGVSTGIATISYTSSLGCARTTTVSITSGVAAISGASSICVGNSSAFTDATTGGTWSSSSTAIATVGSSTGIVTGVSAGSANITYALSGGCRAVMSVSIGAGGAALTGTPTVCISATTTLATTDAGGTWSASNSSASVDGAGNVMGVSAGTVVITYLNGSGCYATKTVTVKALPVAITGASSVCTGSSTTLTDASPVGISWTSSDASIATIGITSGVLTGVSAGVVSITYLNSTGCSISTAVTVNPLAIVTGTATVCAGSVTSLSSSLSGTWSSGSASVATVDTSGNVTGVAGGTANITFTSASGCRTITVATVNALPNTITGSTTICTGSTSALSSTTTGGTWGSSDGTVATVDASSGIVSTVGAGTSIISYTNAAGCSRSVTVTVTSAIASIAGSSSVCTGSTTALTDAASGGTWSSSSTAVATVSASGVVTGVSAGTANITYATSGGCRSVLTIAVSAGAAAISGATSVCINASTALSATDTGGTWISGNTSLATVDASGNVTGVATGTVSISYMLASGCVATHSVVVKSLPAAISGASALCIGATATYTDAATGGISWISSDAAIATIGSTSGVATGVAAGIVDLTYTISTGCFITTSVSVNATPASISGVLGTCVGLSTALGSTTTGGTWASSSTATATVDASSGMVTGVTAGTVRITYFAGGCFTTATVTVSAIPAVITGATTICMGSTSALADATTGGVWTSSDSTIASVSASGVVTGVATGSAMISYSAGGCPRIATVSVTSPASSISGTLTVCTGTTSTLTDAAGGGTWSSSNTAVATVSAAGVVGGVTAGTANITYVIAAGCNAVATVTVNTGVPANTGTAVVAVGSTTALSNTVSGGIWSSSNTAQATVDTSGVVTGVAAGNPFITYTVGSCYAATVITVTAAVAPVTGVLTVCVGSTSTLVDATSGLSWTSSNTSIATIGSTSGVVTGVAIGTATISYHTTTGIIVTAVVTVNAALPSITGTATVCIGSTITKADAVTGGIWSVANTTFATVDSTAGVVTGVTNGVTTITYNSAGCIKTTPLTVNALPAVISGASSICITSTATLTDGTTGGTWSSADATIASVGSTGIVTGVASGVTGISYTLSTGCARVQTVTVAAAPANVGSTSLCVSTPSAFTNPTTGGTWSSSNPAVGSINSSTGVATGVAAGTANITYAISAGCRSITNVTVNALPAAITGTANACVAASSALSDATTGGTWSSASSLVTVGSSAGVITGVTAGTALVSYTSPVGCVKSVSFTVKALPGTITGSSAVCVGSTATVADGVGLSWSSSNTAVGTIGVTSGIFGGVSAGTTILTFTSNIGCIATRIETVNVQGSISGSSSVSIAASMLSPVLYTETVSDGTWASSNTARATIDAGGHLTGVSAGAVTISYIVAGCTTATFPVTITSPRGVGNNAHASENPTGIQIYPNPTSGALNISSETDGTFIVYTIDGKVLQSYAVAAGVTNISLPQGIAAGNYIGRFTGTDGSIVTIQIAYKP